MKVVRHLQRNDTDTEKVVRQLQDRHKGSAGPAYTFHVTGIDKIPERTLLHMSNDIRSVVIMNLAIVIS